jgi:outer membrane protein OmpA-like peptidoglycan-associated protein
MKAWVNTLAAAATLLGLLAGCAYRDRILPAPVSEEKTAPSMPDRPKADWVVLLPEPDGRPGAIRVTTQGGSQVLEKSGHATRVEDFTMPPTPPETIDQNEITRVFGEALSAQPNTEVRFSSFILWFENNETTLTRESKKLLTEIVGMIKGHKSNEIYVIGHTDRVGTEFHNQKLSERRANYIKDFLVFGGIQSSALIVSSHGETMPLVYTEDEVAEPRNRRVEVIVR